MNDQEITRRLRRALDEVDDPAHAEGTTPLPPWNRWNDIRKIALVAACVLVGAGGIWGAARWDESADEPAPSPLDSPIATTDEQPHRGPHGVAADRMQLVVCRPWLVVSPDAAPKVGGWLSMTSC